MVAVGSHPARGVSIFTHCTVMLRASWRCWQQALARHFLLERATYYLDEKESSLFGKKNSGEGKVVYIVGGNINNNLVWFSLRCFFFFLVGATYMLNELRQISMVRRLLGHLWILCAYVLCVFGCVCEILQNNSGIHLISLHWRREVEGGFVKV